METWQYKEHSTAEGGVQSLSALHMWLQTTTGQYMMVCFALISILTIVLLHLKKKLGLCGLDNCE